MAITAVMIDSREPQWVQALTFGGVPTATIQLEHGDALVTCNDSRILSIERKTSDDLLGSIADNRLLAQASQLTSVSPWAYVIITGVLQRGPGDKVITDRGLTGWNWNAVQGALLTVQELGVMILFADDYEQAVIRLSNRKRDAVPISPARPPRILSAGEQALLCLPGIGLKNLDTLLSMMPSVADALCELTSLDGNGTRLPGIGRGIKHSIKRALGLNDHEYMTILTPPPEIGGNNHE